MATDSLAAVSPVPLSPGAGWATPATLSPPPLPPPSDSPALQDPYFAASPGVAPDDAMHMGSATSSLASPAGIPYSPGGVLPSPGGHSAGLQSPGTALQSPGTAWPSPGAIAPSPTASTHSASGLLPGAAATPMSVPGAALSVIDRDAAEPLPWPVTPDGQDEVCSFFNLARAPPVAADVAAKRFLNLLSLHMEGMVTLQQEEAYGDISVHRAPGWPGSLVVGDCIAPVTKEQSEDGKDATHPGAGGPLETSTRSARIVSGFGTERCEDVDVRRRQLDQDALQRASVRQEEWQRGRARDMQDRDLDRSAGGAWHAGM